MDYLIFDVLKKHCGSLRPSLLQEVFEKYVDIFEEELNERIRRDVATLEDAVNAASEVLNEPLELHEKKLNEFIFMTIQTESNFSKEVEKFIQSQNKRIHKIHDDLVHTKDVAEQKVKAAFKTELPEVVTSSPLDHRILRDKLEIAAVVGDLVSGPDWIEDFRKIDSELGELFGNGSSSNQSVLDFLEKALPQFPETLRANIIGVMERWLSDRSTSSTDVRKLVEAQTQLIIRKNRFKYGIGIR
jgi:hypothetical protein